jgi:histidinol-phosphatase
MCSVDDDLQIAHNLADIAATVSLGYFGRPNRSERKPDGSPVGEADLAVEQAMVRRLHELRPGDAVLSEEAGTIGVSSRRWILDPIDGTAVFLAGEPHWGTHIALEVDNEIALGVITRPVLGLRWWATRGHGAYRACIEAGEPHDVRRLRTSSTVSLADSQVTGWPVATLPIDALRSAGTWTPCDFNDLLRVPEGDVEVMVVPGAVWDHAPFLVLLEEAGGSLLDPAGGRRLDLGSAIYTNGRVDREVMAILDR